jgi:hypothetical protein
MNYNTVAPRQQVVIMRINFDQLETHLQSLVERGIARIFPPGIDQQNLSSQLIAEMQANLQIQPDGNYLAANLFFITLHPAHALILAENQAFLDELAALLTKIGAEADLQFPSPPKVRVIPDSDFALGESSVLAEFHLDHLVDTSTLTADPVPEKPDLLQAFLIVNGSEIFPLSGKVVNIGRNSENQVVVLDLRVSRFHAQLRTIRDRYVIFDLDSTGGTFVNEKRITQCVLHPGDVISLAGVPLIYGQDFSPLSGETQDINTSYR